MVDESTIDTNLLYATVDDQVITALKFVERLEKVYFLIRIIEWLWYLNGIVESDPFFADYKKFCGQCFSTDFGCRSKND